MNTIPDAQKGSGAEHACDADRPGAITDAGWLAALTRLVRSLGQDDMWLRSAGVAFCGLFAAIPAISVPVGLLGLLAPPEAVHRPVEMLGGLLPQAATLFMADQLQAIASTSRTQLGAGLGGGVLAALWGGWSGASGLIAALNVAYRETEGRSFAHRSRDALIVALAAALFLVLAFGLVAILPLVLGRLSLPEWLQTTLSAARWPLLGALFTAALSLLYRFAPCRRAAKWRWVSPGALAASVLWLVGSAAFSFYVSRFTSYNETLGVLGTVMMLLTWSYLTAFAVLLGAELNAELERQTTQDTTRGPARIRGERGAAVADRALDAA